MNRKQLRAQCRPHLWFQLYWVVYLIWFFWLDLTITDPKYIIHSRIDDRIPFNEWFIFPYCSWFLLLAGVTALLWWCDTQSYDKLCLTMFSGMTFCLILYMLLPNGLKLRPTAEDVGRSNIAMSILQLIWKADASVNVCPSIHYQSSACMALAFTNSRLAKDRPALKVLAWGWAALIHGVHQTALHHRCGVRSGRGLRVGAGGVPPCRKMTKSPWPGAFLAHGRGQMDKTEKKMGDF